MVDQFDASFGYRGYIFFSRVKDVFLLTDESEGAMTATLQENLTGIRVVRAFARQDHEIKQVRCP